MGKGIRLDQSKVKQAIRTMMVVSFPNTFFVSLISEFNYAWLLSKFSLSAFGRFFVLALSFFLWKLYKRGALEDNCRCFWWWRSGLWKAFAGRRLSKGRRY